MVDAGSLKHCSHGVTPQFKNLQWLPLPTHPSQAPWSTRPGHLWLASLPFQPVWILDSPGKICAAFPTLSLDCCVAQLQGRRLCTWLDGIALHFSALPSAQLCHPCHGPLCKILSAPQLAIVSVTSGFRELSICMIPTPSLFKMIWAPLTWNTGSVAHKPPIQSPHTSVGAGGRVGWGDDMLSPSTPHLSQSSSHTQPSPRPLCLQDAVSPHSGAQDLSFS